MKTPEELAFEWWVEYSKDKDLNKWDTVDPTVGFVAGYNARKRQEEEEHKQTEGKIEAAIDRMADRVQAWWLRDAK
jgi:hypothetical protein